MRFRKKNIDFVEESTEQNELKKGSFKSLLDGSLLTRKRVIRQLPFILFLTFLAIIYIGNRYHAEKIVRKTVVLQNEIKELRAEAITTASELMFISKQSEVSKLVKQNNLKLEESVEPPTKINISKRK